MSTNYTDRIRRLAANDIGATGELTALDAKTLALVRLAALIAVGAAEPSFGEHADAAVSAGATSDEIVDVLVGVGSVVGLPRVVAAAPLLGLALGYDVEDDVLG